MAEVYEIFSEDLVYECECGGSDFWVVPPPDDLSMFKGFVCQGCEKFFAFPEYVKRIQTLTFFNKNK